MNTWNYGELGRREVFDHFAEVVKAMGNGRRLELLETLAQGEHSVEVLARKTGLAMTTASNNLQTLKRVGLVETRREGTSIYYRLAGNDVLELFVAAKRVAMHRYPALVDSVEAYLGEAAGPGISIDPADVTEDMFVLDVRPQSEYDAAHFPGAVSIPMDEFEDRIDEIPRDKHVVVYCRGEFCKYAREVAQKLREHGVSAQAMTEGVIEWQASKEIRLDHTA